MVSLTDCGRNRALGTIGAVDQGGRAITVRGSGPEEAVPTRTLDRTDQVSEDRMIRTQRWTTPALATLTGWIILGLTTAGASEITGAADRSPTSPDLRGNLDDGLGRVSPAVEERTALGDVESLGRRLAGLDPRRTLLDRMTALPAAGEALLPDALTAT